MMDEMSAMHLKFACPHIWKLGVIHYFTQRAMADTTTAPKLLVLPRESTDNARILTLAHPRTLKPSRYYFDPVHGIYEFTRIAASKAACRSWLLKSQPGSQLKRKRGEDEVAAVHEKRPKRARDIDELSIENGHDEEAMPNDYVIKNAELLVATPMDPVFILLPLLTDQTLFLSADDLLDRLSEKSKHFTPIICNEPTRKQMEARLESVCDLVDAGDEQMYRLNKEKMLAELVRKAEKMVASALPISMEERFIRRNLETPLATVKREDSSLSANGNHTPMSEATATESVESQASMVSMGSVSTITSAETEMTVPDDPNTNDFKDLHHLLRLRTALSFMLSSYFPAPLAASVTVALASEKSPVDFKPLDTRLAEIANLQAEASAVRSLGDFSRKRNMHEEDDVAESKLEKKKRKEEEERKMKAGETRGVRDLKKVDTKGMKKMSDFFRKRTSPRKKA